MSAYMGTVDWDEFDVFEEEIGKYMPSNGEGETKASQIATAVNKLVYKWYNDGDVFDNTHVLEGWCNDLSSYANWLFFNTTQEIMEILNRISTALTHTDYEKLLFDLATKALDKEYLERMDKIEKTGTIYDCEGKFKFVC